MVWSMLFLSSTRSSELFEYPSFANSTFPVIISFVRSPLRLYGKSSNLIIRKISRCGSNLRVITNTEIIFVFSKQLFDVILAVTSFSYFLTSIRGLSDYSPNYIN